MLSGAMMRLSSRLSDDSSGVFSSAVSTSGGAEDSLTRALEELRLRDSEVEEEAAAAAAAAEEEEEEVAMQAEAEGAGDFQAIKRCASLGGGGAGGPVGRQRVKKVVRFADALGLDLTSVRHVINFDSQPTFEREPSASLAPPMRPRQRLLVTPCFPQPGSCSGFISRVMSQKVMLERATVGPDGAISGAIRVCNLHFEKTVSVRVTFDGWRSCRDVPAAYRASEAGDSGGGCCGVGGGMTDQFVFRVALPAGFGSAAGDRAALCVRFTAAGQTYWDSNYCEDYAFDCLPVSWAGIGEEAKSLARFC